MKQWRNEFIQLVSLLRKSRNGLCCICVGDGQSLSHELRYDAMGINCL